MALTATIYNLDIDLADSDRSVYETLALRVARHPSESPEYLVARVLAYAMEFTEGIEFSRGICDPDDPAIAVRDLTGALRAWIDVGSPDAARLHKASKLAPRVAVYTHKDIGQIVRNLAGEDWYVLPGRCPAARAHLLDQLRVTIRRVFLVLVSEAARVAELCAAAI